MTLMKHRGCVCRRSSDLSRRPVPPLRPLLLLLAVWATLYSIGENTFGVEGARSVLSSSSSPSCKATGDDGAVITKTTSVESSEDAAQLASDLQLCAGEDFDVAWRGAVTVSQSLELANGTSLTITGFEEAIADGGGSVSSIFVVDGADLHVKGMSLTGGGGVEGGVVRAQGGATVTLVDCDVYGNTVSAKGGAIFLDYSRFILGGTNFTANTADVFGGAIAACNASTITADEDTENFFEHNVAKYGGAVFVADVSNLTLVSGDATLLRNKASIQGGAIYAETGSVVEISGKAGLIENEAAESSGGAIYVKGGSTIIASGNTSFIDNISHSSGGAIMVTRASTLIASGSTMFRGNHADFDGGAIQAEIGSKVNIEGGAIFLRNSADTLGGAISGNSGASLTVSGTTSFISNTAVSGGALGAEDGVDVKLLGTLVFDGNTAQNDGGALYLTYAKVSVGGRSKFTSNRAEEGSGGAIYANKVTEITVSKAKFKDNTALWGGAVATFSSGGQPSSSSSQSLSADPSSSTTSESSTPTAESASSSLSTEGPVTYKKCTFDANSAVEDGGAIYSVAGFDIIRDSRFVRNRAGASGGAFVHAGVCESIRNCDFRGNIAGNEGPAILSLGLLSTMKDTTFEENDFICEAGTYSSSEQAEGDTCRFTEVCSRCMSECHGALEEGVTLAKPNVLPVCEDAPPGAVTTVRGGRLETLELLPGFYRSMETSTDIRECFYEEACQGGAEVGGYCAEGYGGPYCAVCKEGYAPGYYHTCKSCMGGNGKRAVAIMAFVACLVLVAVGLVIARLVSIVEAPSAAVAAITSPEGDEGKTVDTGGVRWKAKLGALQQRLVKRFPLTAVKIVVVVWQIVTQYSDLAGVKYPGAYEDFLAMIDMVNLDLGFILSFACVYNTTFYDRLLMATLGPFVVLLVLGCTYVVALRRNRASDESVAAVKSRHLSVALFVLFVAYATVSHAIFETFVCDNLDDGESYLRADYSLKCTTTQHTAFRIYAALMVLIYPVGIPCVFGWWLWQHRYELKTAPDRKASLRLKPAADLWEPYKRDKYYYEVVECFRRITLTGLAVFIYPESSAQIAVVLLLAVVFMVVSEILSPFSRPVEMWLYRAGHYVVFASMYLALLLRVDVSSERSQSQDVFSGVIVIAHAAMLLVVIAQGILIFMGWGELVETPEGIKAVTVDRNSADFTLEYPRDNSYTNENPAYGNEMFRIDPGTCLEEEKLDEKRAKRWETWERPAPRAKSSFFPDWQAKEESAFQTAPGAPPAQWNASQMRCRSLSPKRFYTRPVEATERPAASGKIVQAVTPGSPDLTHFRSTPGLSHPEPVACPGTQTLEPQGYLGTSPQSRSNEHKSPTTPSPSTMPKLETRATESTDISVSDHIAIGSDPVFSASTHRVTNLLAEETTAPNTPATKRVPTDQRRSWTDKKMWKPLVRLNKAVGGRPLSLTRASTHERESQQHSLSMSPKRWFSARGASASVTLEQGELANPRLGNFHSLGAPYASDGPFLGHPDFGEVGDGLGIDSSAGGITRHGGRSNAPPLSLAVRQNFSTAPRPAAEGVATNSSQVLDLVKKHHPLRPAPWLAENTAADTSAAVADSATTVVEGSVTPPTEEDPVILRDRPSIVLKPLTGGFHKRGASYTSDGSFLGHGDFMASQHGGRRGNGRGSAALSIDSSLSGTTKGGVEAEKSPLSRLARLEDGSTALGRVDEDLPTRHADVASKPQHVCPKRWFGVDTSSASPAVAQGVGNVAEATAGRAVSETDADSTTPDERPSDAAKPLSGAFHTRGSSFTSDGSFLVQGEYAPWLQGGRRGNGPGSVRVSLHSSTSGATAGGEETAKSPLSRLAGRESFLSELGPVDEDSPTIPAKTLMKRNRPLSPTRGLTADSSADAPAAVSAKSDEAALATNRVAVVSQAGDAASKGMGDAGKPAAGSLQFRGSPDPSEGSFLGPGDFTGWHHGGRRPYGGGSVRISINSSASEATTTGGEDAKSPLSRLAGREGFFLSTSAMNESSESQRPLNARVIKRTKSLGPTRRLAEKIKTPAKTPMVPVDERRAMALTVTAPNRSALTTRADPSTSLGRPRNDDMARPMSTASNESSSRGAQAAGVGSGSVVAVSTGRKGTPAISHGKRATLPGSGNNTSKGIAAGNRRHSGGRANPPRSGRKPKSEVKVVTKEDGGGAAAGSSVEGFKPQGERGEQGRRASPGGGRHGYPSVEHSHTF